MERIYMDHAATTPLHPAVREIMCNTLSTYGNPSSIHGAGREAKAVIRKARDTIASSLGCSPQELIFTSGGSESDNTAIFGVLWAQWLKRKENQLSNLSISDVRPHLITTEIEHHAVLHAAEQAERMGFEVTYVKPDSRGIILPEVIEAAIKPQTCLISVMYVNNEVGTIQPIDQIGNIAHAHGILMHTDAVQALGHMAFKLNELPIDFASFSAHKINGPKGIGLLYAKQGSEWEPLMFGGSQERNRRAGTENVSSISAFAEAVIQAYGSAAIFEHKVWEISQLRDLLWNSLKEQLGERVIRNGDPKQSAPHILNVSFLDVPTETMIMNLDMQGIMVSSGSACTSGSLEVSHVLKAMQLPDELARTAVRFSLGLGNTKEQVQEAVKRIGSIVSRVRARG